MTDDIVTITAMDRSYRIHNPGGRIGSKIADGAPYERRLLYAIHERHRFSGGVAFDIGAHVGNHTLFLAAITGLDVVAIEPHPASFDALTLNLNLNPALLPGPHDGPVVVTRNMAAGRHPSRAAFRGRMVLKLDRGDVPVVPIDDMDVDMGRVSVVKVDVEGMEPDALAGMAGFLERDHPVVWAEVHTPERILAVNRVLDPFGYRATTSIRMGSTMMCWEAT